MIGCLWTRVRKQPINALYFESENELKFYNLEARMRGSRKVCQRGSDFDNVFLVDEGREDSNTTINRPSSAR